jgi:TorA maturation chaperone TorD
VYFNDERLLFQEQTQQVRQWYLRYGVEPEHSHTEPDDHIGLELAFLAHLAQRGLQALEQNDPAAFEDSMAAQRGFLAEHLLKWASAWCGLVLEHARTDFYRGVALLTRGALTELAHLFELKLMPEPKR